MDEKKSISDLLKLHFEKLVLAGICGLSGLLIYLGMGAPSFLDTLQPPQLAQKATEAKRLVDEAPTENVLAKLEKSESLSYAERIQQLQQEIPFEEYRHVPYEPRSLDDSIKRSDVTLLPPIDLKVSGVLTSIALKAGRATSYPVLELEDAPEVEEEESTKPAAKPKKPKRSRRGMYGDEMDFGMEYEMEMDFGMEGAGMEEMGGVSRRRMLGSKYNQGAEVQKNPPPRPRTPGAPPAPPKPLNTVPSTALFIAGRAVVPHRELVEAYKLAFEKSSDYSPARDMPVYLGYDVQRADVTEKQADALEETDWINIDGWKRLNEYASSYWNGYAKDIVPADYREQRLTSLIPPVLLDDFTRFATHPKIPLKTMAELAREADDPLSKVEVVDLFKEEAGDADAVEAPVAVGRGRTRRSQERKEPEYKLVRFYDFFNQRVKHSPQLGRRYVYRIRVRVEDPNFPELASKSPSLRSLAPEVFQRVALKAQEAEKNKQRDFTIFSPWSEPSDSVRLPSPVSIYAGPVVTPMETREVAIEGRPVDFVRTPATAKSVARTWDTRFAVPVPAPFEIRSGSVLNRKLAADVVDPLTLAIKQIPDYTIRSEAVVLDVYGGVPLELEEAEGLTSPGQYLVFDPYGGGIRVLEEIDDKFSFSRYTYTEDVVPSSKPAGGMPAMDGYGPADGFGMEF